MPRIITAVIAALVWLGTFTLHLGFLEIYNDHFDRIARGRQIARYGELPFRDFLDPGYFLTEFASAAVQRIAGDNLLGEMLLSGVFMATGAVVVTLLALRVSQSYLLAVAASLFAVLLLPRPYDYDKFLFYPLGLLLCWRYVERRRVVELAILAAGLVVAALFRYDSAAYVGVAAVVAIVAVHAREPRLMARRLLLLVALVPALAAPAVAFVHLNGGLGNAIDQVTTYGRREARPLQLVVIDPPPPDAGEGATVLTRLRSLPGRIRMPPQLYQSRASAFLYFGMMALPLVALGVAVARRFRSDGDPAEHARWLSLIAMCIMLNLFILRPPIMARIGGMAGPAAVLIAALAGIVWRHPGVGGAVAKAAVVAALASIGWTVSLAANWDERFRSDASFRERITGNVAALAESPPDPARFSGAALAGLVSYLRACTAPEDAVFATWFAPELSFFSQRAFGARMAATWQWSDTRFQRRSSEALASRPTIVIVHTPRYADFESAYPILSGYLRLDYRVAGESQFGDPGLAGVYQVLVHKTRVPVRVHEAFSIPCFA